MLVLQESPEIFKHVLNEFLLFAGLFFVPGLLVLFVPGGLSLLEYGLQEVKIPQLNKRLVEVLVGIDIKDSVDDLASELLEVSVGEIEEEVFEDVSEG